MRRILFFSAVISAALFLSIPTAAQVRDKVPDFVLSNMDGGRVDISSYRGKVVVLNLWFINCPNCVAEIKMLNEIVDQYKDKNDVVFLAPAASSRADLQKFLVKNPFKFTVLPDAQNVIIGKFGVPDTSGMLTLPFPMHYVVDREGFIVAKAQGIKGVDAVKAELKRQFTK